MPKVFGDITELDDLVFSEDSFAITVRPNASTTYTAARTISLPDIDANEELTGLAATQTLTNKTLTSPVLTTPQINDTSSDHQYIFAVSELTADRTVTLPLLTGNDTLVFESHAQTLSNKTFASAVLTAPEINDTSSDHQYVFGVSELAADRTVTLPLLTGNDTFVFEAHAQTLSNKVLTLPEINDTSSDHQYVFAVNELTADRTVTLPLLTGNDTFVFEAHTQTLTNKTLTSPVLTTPQINDTSLDHQYVFAVSELTADRTVTLPLLTGNDEFTFNSHTQTLSNKTLDTPTVSTGAVFANQAYMELREQTGNGTNYMRITAPDAVTSSTTLKLPDGDGSNGQAITTDGSGNLSFTTVATATNFEYQAKSADYVITDSDDARTIGVTAGSSSFTFGTGDVDASGDTITETSHGLSDGQVVHLEPDAPNALPAGLENGVSYYIVGSTAHTFQLATSPGGSAVDITNTGTGSANIVYVGVVITLPTSADNDNRLITVTKVDDTPNRVLIKGESTETINGKNYVELFTQHDVVEVQSDGSNWRRLRGEWHAIEYVPNINALGPTLTSGLTYQRIGNSVVIRGHFITGTVVGGEAQLSLPNNLTISTYNAFTGAQIVSMVAGNENSGAFRPALASGGDTFLNFAVGDGSNNPLIADGGSTVFSSSTRYTLGTCVIPVDDWA